MYMFITLFALWLQSIPLHITQDVLKHMSNNYMIVEVWEKRAAGQKDQVSEVFTLQILCSDTVSDCFE